MDEIKQSSIYLRVLWYEDNENIRPKNIDIKLTGENTEDVIFSISKEDNNTGNNSPWNQSKWVNGALYNYKKELIEVNEDIENDIEQFGVSNIPYIIPKIIDNDNIKNYRQNIIKNSETEEYAYYTIKMTYIPPKIRKKTRSISTSSSMNFNGTTIENVNFNGQEIDKVNFNGITVFENNKIKSFAEAIVSNSTVNDTIPDFSLTATTDEGMFITDDPMYGENAKSYYFRGAVTNNYVKFAGLWWRIIRINGDGSIRIIYDGKEARENGQEGEKIISSQKYNLSYSESSYVGWTYTLGNQRPTNNETASKVNVHYSINNWYNRNLTSYEDKIENGKFCNDRSVGKDSSGKQGKWSEKGAAFKYSGYARVFNEYNPTLNCPAGDEYILKAGIITSDEVMFAGGAYKINREYYLHVGYSYWTMTPNGWSGSVPTMNTVASSYAIGTSNLGSTNCLIPVINLKADVKILSGDGTIDNPYVVE